MSNRYQQCFAALEANNEGAFVPFVTIGDPNIELSEAIIRTLIDNGADALELGIPFSDPIADGPVIQKASIRALQSGVNTEQCFALLARIRKDYPDIPIGLLLYSNLVVGKGIQDFYQQASAAGVDSVLIADVPVIESEPFIDAAKENNISPIFIATPNADPETLKLVAELGDGYTYLLSRAGVTGTDVKAGMPVDSILAKLRDFDAPPPLLGFGISNPEQVKQAIDSGAAGAISGSAVVRIIEENLDNEAELKAAIAKFLRSMKTTTKKS